MEKKIFIYIGIAIITVSIVAGVGFTLNSDDKNQEIVSLPELEFTYDESNLQLKQNLESQDT